MRVAAAKNANRPIRSPIEAEAWPASNPREVAYWLCHWTLPTRSTCASRLSGMRVVMFTTAPMLLPG